MALTLDRILELFSPITPFAITLLFIFSVNVPVVPKESMRPAILGDRYTRSFGSPVRHFLAKSLPIAMRIEPFIERKSGQGRKEATANGGGR